MKIVSHILLVVSVSSMLLPTIAGAKPVSKKAKQGYATIKGVPSYPSDEIPVMGQYAENIETKQVYRVDTKINQKNYTMVLPAPAKYRFYSWVGRDFSSQDQAAAYTVCNGQYKCMENKNAHDFAIVSVKPNQVIKNLRISDWFYYDKLPNLVPIPPKKVTILTSK